jgi:hypothetical protein
MQKLSALLPAAPDPNLDAPLPPPEHVHGDMPRTGRLLEKLRAAVLAGLAGTVVFGIALLLTPARSPSLALGAAEPPTAACSSSSATVGYVTAFTSGTGYAVTAVTVAGLGHLCGGRRLEVALTADSGSALANGAAVVPLTDGPVTVPLIGSAPVFAVRRTHIVVG